MTTPDAAQARTLRRATAALLAGNFAIGSGVMVVAGGLNDLAHGLDVSVAVAGQLISVAAAVMAVGAPVLAALVSGRDRRRLLTWTLLWYAAGHALCCLTQSYAALMVLRALTVLGAAVFTPQAAAAIGHMALPHQRGRAITTTFLGWSLSSVLGTPLFNLMAETLGWRWSFATVAALAAVCAVWVWRVMPDGVKPPALQLQHWREALTHPVLMAIVAVTALSSTGQFAVLSYLAPYFKQVLGASPPQIGALYLWFGLFGLIGNVTLTRWIDRLGPNRSTAITLGLMLLGLSAFPWAVTIPLMGLVLVPWGLGCFASNSAQQARLGLTAPLLAPALIAMNTTAIYAGQGLGAASGGLLISLSGMGALAWFGMGWVVLALALSAWAARAGQRRLATAVPS